MKTMKIENIKMKNFCIINIVYVVLNFSFSHQVAEGDWRLSGHHTKEIYLIQITDSHVFYGVLLNMIISHHFIFVFLLKNIKQRLQI